MFGLEIVEQSGGKIARGSVYVLLGRLQVAGFVSESTQALQAGSDNYRRRYKITAEGRRALRHIEYMEAIWVGGGHEFPVVA